MKPGEPPKRRTELRRTGGPTRRKPLRPSPGAAVPLRARSPMRAAVGYRQQQATTRTAVYTRDGRCRLHGSPLFGPCVGRRTVHHLRKAGQGGAYTMSNLIWLCAGHNDRVEELPRADMVALGLVIPRECLDPGRAWALLQLAGIVAYWWDGTPSSCPRPDAMHAVLGGQDPHVDGRLP